MNHEKYHRFLLFPDEKIYYYWTTIIIAAICYSATVTPFLVCFMESDEIPIFWMILGYVIDILFMVDIILNFVTPDFDDEDILIIDTKLLAINYIFGWFIPDLIATLPFELLF